MMVDVLLVRSLKQNSRLRLASLVIAVDTVPDTVPDDVSSFMQSAYA